METTLVPESQRDEFIQGLLNVVPNHDWLQTDIDLDGRDMYITLSTANYGNPSTCVIEWNGSPSRCPIYITVDEHLYGNINGHWFNDYTKQSDFKEYVVKFLKQHNYMQ